MMPRDLAEALSDRLRTRGVDFLPEDVQTFTAGLPDEERGPDVEAMVGRFIQSLRDRAVELHNKRRQGAIGWLIGTLLFGVGGLLLVGTALGLTDDTDGDPAVVRVIELVMAGGFLFGSALMALSFRRSARAWRASARRGPGQPEDRRLPDRPEGWPRCWRPRQSRRRRWTQSRTPSANRVSS